LGQGVEHGFQESDQVVPQPLQIGEFAGLFLQLTEHIADGLGPLIVLQEIGQQTVAEKGLG